MQYKKYLKIGGIILAVLVGAVIVLKILFSGVFYSSNMGVSRDMEMGDYVGSTDGMMQKSAPMEMEESLSGSAPYGDGSEVSADKKIIKEGSMTLRVNKVDSSVERIREIAKSYQGEIFSTNFTQSSTNVKSGTIVVKVPVQQFDKAHEELKTVADIVLRESSTGQDVTEQYTDLQSRLKNKRAEEQSYLALLERAGDMSDVLKVTKALSSVRGEIELLQGRIRMLESRTDMSTITIYLSEDPNITVADTWRPWQEVKEAVNELLKGLQGFVSLLIEFVVIALPMLILYGAVLLILFLAGRKVYRRIWKK